MKFIEDYKRFTSFSLSLIILLAIFSNYSKILEILLYASLPIILILYIVLFKIKPRIKISRNMRHSLRQARKVIKKTKEYKMYTITLIIETLILIFSIYHFWNGREFEKIIGIVISTLVYIICAIITIVNRNGISINQKELIKNFLPNHFGYSLEYGNQTYYKKIIPNSNYKNINLFINGEMNLFTNIKKITLKRRMLSALSHRRYTDTDFFEATFFHINSELNFIPDTIRLNNLLNLNSKIEELKRTYKNLNISVYIDTDDTSKENTTLTDENLVMSKYKINQCDTFKINIYTSYNDTYVDGASFNYKLKTLLITFEVAEIITDLCLNEYLK